MTHTSHSVAETEQVAADVSRTLVGGACIALEGDLGAGKTQFVRGLVIGFGGDGRDVSSPTYVLMNLYDAGRVKVYHLDAYRVGGAQDFEAMGFDELLEQRDAVVVVEWASRVRELIPPNHIAITIEQTGESSRTIGISRISALPPGEGRRGAAAE